LGDHGDPVHHFGVTGSAVIGAAGPTGSRAGAGLDTLGIDVESGSAVCQDGHPGFGFSRAGAGTRRDDGSDHGNREHADDQRVSVFPGRFDRFGDCEPVYGGYGRPIFAVPGRIRTGAIPDDFYPERAGALADCGDNAKRQRGTHLMSARVKWRRFVSNFMLTLTGLCALVSVSVLFLILGYLVFNGGTSINWAFFTQLPKPVGEAGGGMANAIVGSAKLLMAASLIGVPIGFLGGVYLAEFSGSAVASVVRYAADLLNGVPSIVIGIFAYSMVVLPFKHFSTLAGAFALGLMMIPITLRSTEEFLNGVPRYLREGAMALGASKWKTIGSVVVPAAYRGILTSILLALARVAGETAPLLFTAFGNRYWSQGWGQPTASLPVMIFTYAVSPYEDWHRQAWAAGLVLLGLILIINILARTILSRGIAVPRS